MCICMQGTRVLTLDSVSFASQSVLPLVVRYIKLIYSWSVHPARQRRTHSITVTVRSAHSMASSSTSESDSLQVSSACKAQRWFESQSRRLNNEGEIFFRASRRQISTMHLFALARPNTKLLPMALHSIATQTSTFLDPPLLHVDLDCH